MAPEASRRLREYLLKPECREFQRHLRCLAAERTAEAGNILCASEEGNKSAEAQAKADEAQWLLWLDELIDQMKNSEYSFSTKELQPITATQPTYGNSD